MRSSFYFPVVAMLLELGRGWLWKAVLGMRVGVLSAIPSLLLSLCFDLGLAARRKRVWESPLLSRPSCSFILFLNKMLH